VQGGRRGGREEPLRAVRRERWWDEQGKLRGGCGNGTLRWSRLVFVLLQRPTILPLSASSPGSGGRVPFFFYVSSDAVGFEPTGRKAGRGSNQRRGFSIRCNACSRSSPPIPAPITSSAV